MTEALVAATRLAIDDLARDWRARYGDVVLDVAVSALEPGRVRVEGHVLVPSQRDALSRALHGAIALAGAPADALQIDVEPLTASSDTLRWGTPALAAAAVRTRPGPDGDLATELVPGDPPARVLAERGAWCAVELADRTVGWVAAEALAAVPPPGTIEAWRAAWVGSAREAAPDAWRRAAVAWLHVPYRLGGNSREGIDCSGLSQRLYRAVLGVGLPKHSSDQARCGERVARDALAPGDLMHLTHVERGTSHVAVVVDAEPSLAVHASFEHGQVVLESVDDLLDRYVLRAIRRFPSGSVPVRR